MGEKITICIPHWQAEEFMRPCLRSIRKHSHKYDLEIIIIDNGSKDASLDYLKSLDWIEIIERPEEAPENWPTNVFTAWDRGLEAATGDYYITMHSDVFIKADNWLDPFISTISSAPNTVASGSSKLEMHHPLYAFQKRVFGGFVKNLKRLLPWKKPKIDKEAGRYPRDYCAMYKTSFLRENDIVFATEGHISGGHQVALQIWEKGGETRTFPVHEMDRVLAHIAHGTSAITDRINLRRKRKQDQVVRKKTDLFNRQWIQDLIHDDSLDQ